MVQNGDITVAMLLQHMQDMEGRIISRFDHTDARIAKLETKVDHNHLIVTTQLDNIDARLDDIEVVQVPALKKAVAGR